MMSEPEMRATPPREAAAIRRRMHRETVAVALGASPWALTKRMILRLIGGKTNG